MAEQLILKGTLEGHVSSGSPNSQFAKCDTCTRQFESRHAGAIELVMGAGLRKMQDHPEQSN